MIWRKTHYFRKHPFGIGAPNSVFFSQLPEKKTTPTPCRCTTELMAFFQACTEASELPTLLLQSNVGIFEKNDAVWWRNVLGRNECSTFFDVSTSNPIRGAIPGSFTKMSFFFCLRTVAFFWVKHGKKAKNLTHLEDPCMIGIFTCI